MPADRRYRAGESLEDYCRACKTDRLHSIILTDAEAQPLRVSCGYCHSEHNYRAGPRVDHEGGPKTDALQPHGADESRTADRPRSADGRIAALSGPRSAKE